MIYSPGYAVENEVEINQYCQRANQNAVPKLPWHLPVFWGNIGLEMALQPWPYRPYEYLILTTLITVVLVFSIEIIDSFLSVMSHIDCETAFKLQVLYSP